MLYFLGEKFSDEGKRELFFLVIFHVDLKRKREKFLKQQNAK